MSIGYMDQGGIIRSGDWNYQRYNVRSNLSVEVAKGLNVELRLSGRFDNRKSLTMAITCSVRHKWLSRLTPCMPMTTRIIGEP